MSSLLRALRSPRAKTAVDLLAILALFAVLAGPYLRRVYASALPGGWDGVPHYAIADVYARRLFPGIGGWLDEYFAGMPFPTFYPPVFYMTVAALTKLSLSTRAAFWGVQTVASASVPCLTYLAARRLAERGASASAPLASGRIAGLTAGAVCVGFLVDHNPLWRMGVGLESTFDAGLSTQLLGHVFLLVFYWALLAAEGRRAFALLATVALALVPLTNVHMVWSAAFLFAPLVLARVLATSAKGARLRVLGLYGLIGLSALLLSACWVLPMLAHLRFVPTLAQDPPPPGLVTSIFLRASVYVALAGVVAAVRRDGPAIALFAGLVLLLAFTVLPSARYLALGELAIQPARVVAPYPFLAAILVGSLVASVRDAIRSPLAEPIAALACTLAFFAHFKVATKPEALVSAEQVAHYEQALGPIEGRKEGRVLVEMGTEGRSDTFALQALAGMRGARSVTTVFRESALDVLFAVPLRNSFSAVGEAFGVDHKITGEELAAGPPEAQLARLRLFDVRTLAVRSAVGKARAAALPGARLVAQGDPWEVYGLDAEGPSYASVPSYAPVLTFARFSVKPRPEDGVDFVRLGEEMFATARLDVPLALAREPRLDRNEDWARFRVVLITDYRYDRIDRAYEAVEQASRDKVVILGPSADPLRARLVELGRSRPNLRFVPDLEGVREGREAGREACRRVLDSVDAARSPLDGAPAVASARLDGGHVTIELDRAPETPVPVWVRQGYFPSWTSSDGEPVHLATPTFQLTFARGRTVELRFERGRVEWLAWLASVTGLALLGLFARAWASLRPRSEKLAHGS